MAKDDGGYAEPSMTPVDLSGGFAHAMEALDVPTRETGNREYRGMTMRQWYAGMALAAIDVPGITAEEAARLAFVIADAMIAEEKKG